MCLLIWKPKETRFTNAELRDFYDYNSDGFGVMYAEDGALHTHRTVGKFKKVRKLYKRYAEGRDCAIHFRWATHGTKGLENCHPFIVRDGMALMHNGVLTGLKMPDQRRSDTFYFVTDILKPTLDVAPDIYRQEKFAEVLGDEIGAGNKFIILDSDGHKVIVNEHTGVWHKGAWMSNTYAWTNQYTYNGRLIYGADTSDVTMSRAWKEYEQYANTADDNRPIYSRYGEDATLDAALEDFDQWLTLNPELRDPDSAIRSIAAVHGNTSMACWEIEGELWAAWGELCAESEHAQHIRDMAREDDRTDYAG